MPAAAVIRRVQALSGVTGRKELRRWFIKRVVKSDGSTVQAIIRTGKLENGRGNWNFLCRSEIRRYKKEHQWRRQVTGPFLTLRHESVGSEPD